MTIRKIASVAAAGTLALTLAACGSSDGAGEESEPALGKWDAQTHCENLALDRTEDPGNTEFSGPNQTTFVETEPGWKVMGWVDYPNGFGGHVRYDYNCDAELQDNGQVLTNLNVTEQ